MFGRAWFGPPKSSAVEEQKLLFNDPNYSRVVRTSIKGADGSRSIVEKKQKICTHPATACVYRKPYLDAVMESPKLAE